MCIIFNLRAGPMMKATSGLTFEGVKLSVGKNDDRAVKTAGQTLLSRLRDSLNDRFQDVSEGVLRATMLASFKNWTDRESVETGWFFVSEQVPIIIPKYRILNTRAVSVSK